MESLDLRSLADALAWRSGGHAVTLVTWVETWGSAPRPPGAPAGAHTRLHRRLNAA